MAVAVRTAREADAAEVARLLHDFNTEFETPSPGVDFMTGRCRELVAAGEISALLAGEGDGLAVLRFRPALWAAGPDAYLEELYVVPGLRRRGIGLALMDAALKLCRERGAVRVEIGVDEPDLGARALYERLGFRNHDLEDPEARMFFYELEL